MTRLVFAIAAVLLSACHKKGAYEEGPHGHGATATPTKTNSAAAPERPTLAVTKYENGIELFMEYPSFVVGQSSPLVAHVTDARNLNGFRSITQGRVTAILRHADGAEQRFVANKPVRDGIFKPEVTPTKAGEASLALTLEGAQMAGAVNVGKVLIHASVAAAAAAVEREGTERTFSFLKEQQWKTEYATTPAELRVLHRGVRANGEIKPVAGQSAELSAPVAARIPMGEAVPFLGQKVRKGQLMVRLIPTTAAGTSDFATVELEASRARAELGLADRELARAEEMLAAKAIPEKQVDAARVTREVAAARLAAAQRQRALFRSTQSGGSLAVRGSSFELRAPLDGVVSFAEVTPGAVVEAGARLVAVVNTTKLWLEAKVFEPEAPLVERSPGASFSVAGFDSEFTIDQRNGRRVAVGTVVDRATRTVPVIFELVNPDGALKPGMFAKVTLFTGQTVRALAVPESAVVDDNGKPTVFVMEGGESFFKRAVRTGIRSNGFVQILDGIKEGDRVVSRGAYEMKLASASGVIPESGHQH